MVDTVVEFAMRKVGEVYIKPTHLQTRFFAPFRASVEAPGMTGCNGF